MSEPKLISPMLDGFVMGDPISDHNGVRCCPAMNQNTNGRYIVKIISNPATQNQLDALLLTGAYPDANSAKSYFKDLAEGVVEECKILHQLSRTDGFLGYQNYQIVEMENGETGYDVYLLSDYRRTLEQFFRKKPMTHLGAINLGLDICSALSLCRRAGYLYMDLKPSNIHVINDKEYRIADLGFIKLDSLKYSSVPDKYRSQYTAPEIKDAFSSLNETVDIYALGLILYQAYNGGILPFADSAPAEKLPAPQYADYEMSEIILKACDPDPQERWQDPVQLGQALVSYMQRNGVNDVPIVPPAIALEEEAIAEEIADVRENVDTDEDISTSLIAEDVDEAAEEEPSTALILEDNAPTEEAAEDDAVAQVEEAAEELADSKPNLEESIHDTAEISSEVEDLTEEAPEEPATVLMDSGVQEQMQESDTSDEAGIVYTEDDYGNLSFLDETEDETTQELDAEQIEYGEVSDEVSQMMLQIDEIVEHEIPDPVVVPDPIEVPMPEPIVLDEPTEETNDDEDEATTTLMEGDSQEDGESEPQDQEEEMQEDAPEEAIDENSPAPKKKKGLAAVIIILLLAILGCAAFLFYSFIYLQTIDSMEIVGDKNSVTVNISTKTDEALLDVVCADSYGNKMTQPVVDGKAEFKDLLPGTEYTVTVQIEGFHKLDGAYRKAYYTPSQTNIVQLNAVTGAEDGSAIISFTVDGADSEEWKISYQTDNGQAQTQTFTGHTVTLVGLTVGSSYTATVEPVTELYLSGDQQITFTANKLVYAENLVITSCKDGKLTAKWDLPEGANVTAWSVHCYNDDGYSETVITDQTNYTFEGIDNTQNYTVEVSASGQSVSQRTNVEENSITLDPVTAQTTKNGGIALSWSASEEIPQGGWIVSYTVDNTTLQHSHTVNANEFVIKEAIPGQTYHISIQAADESPVVCAPIVVATEAATDFTCSFGGPTITGKDISLSMCLTPAKQNWTRSDLKKSDYKTSFAVGEKASFVIKAKKLYGISDDDLTALYVIKDAEGNILSFGYEEFTWKTLWDYYYGELNLPALPSSAGNYSVTVYFNGDLVGEQAFTVTE